MKKTLIIVDVQNDFLAGGALAVDTAGEEFVKKIESIRPLFDQVLLTADDHPVDHISFSDFPPHCVAGTKGAELAVEIGDDKVLYKGRDKNEEEFSPFGDGKRIEYIEGDEIYVVGLAGDFCVKQSLLDLLQYLPSKKYYAITDLIQSVDKTTYNPLDHFNKQVTFVTSGELMR
jgi:nicotinamidase/pyrazinamidase